MVRVNVSVVVGDGDRQETGSSGYGGREGYDRFIVTDNWQHAADEAVRQALTNLAAVLGRPAKWTSCSAPAGPASCSTRRSVTASKATSTAKRPRRSPA